MIWHFLLVSIQVFLYILYYVLYRCLSNNFEKIFHLVFSEVRNFFKILVTCKKWSVGCFTLVRYPLFLYNHHYHIPDGNIDRSWKIFWFPTIWYGGKIWFLFFSLFQPALLHSISTSASTRDWRTSKVASKVRRKQ